MPVKNVGMIDANCGFMVTRWKLYGYKTYKIFTVYWKRAIILRKIGRIYNHK